MILTVLALLGLSWAACAAPETEGTDSALAEWKFEYRENLIWIQADLGAGRPLNFILDSASTMHVIDSETAARLNLPVSDEKIAVRRTDRFEHQNVTAPLNLKIGGAQIGKVPLLILPLNRTASGTNRIDGIIGSPLFENFMVQIDYKNSKIRLLPLAERGKFNESPAVPLVMQEDLAGIRLADCCNYEGLFVVDTGFSRGVAVAAHARMTFAKNGQPRQSVLYAGGQIPVTFYGRTSWKIGNQTVDGIEAAFCKELAGGLLSDSQWTGLVGNDFLSKFRVTFDLPGRRLYLEPAD